MGRLDDQAKHRIVVLRKAGLSFRKIKKVLELDNIRVTPQAIYLFLKRKNIEPEKSVAAPENLSPKAQPWEEKRLWNLLHQNGEGRGTQDPKKRDTGSQQEVGKEEGGIKIVSVTSLSEGNHSFPPVSSNQRTCLQGQAPVQTRENAVRSSQPPPLAKPLSLGPLSNGPRPAPVLAINPQQLNAKQRLLLPAPRNPALLVTKKIVDRAILVQKKVISQNGFGLPTPGGPYPLPASVTSHSQTVRPCTAAVTSQSQTARIRKNTRTNEPVFVVKDATTQTSPSLQSPATAEQLDSMRGDLHRLTQAVQTLIDRQSRWEQEQHRQQQCNHRDVLQQIQQLRATLTTRAPQNCRSLGTAEETETPFPDLGHFKLELS
ncbi:uncharacterized protein O3C94_018382 [Discoglossus pictus]